MEETRIPNFNTMADLFDRLIVCVNKLAYFENKKRELNRPEWVEHSNKEQIAHWDLASRNECEIRNLLKREIDAEFKRVVESGQYSVCSDFRTFSAPDRTISDILSEQCDAIGTRTRDLLVPK